MVSRGRGLAGAIGTEQRDDFTLVHGEVEVAHRWNALVPGVQTGDLDDRRHGQHLRLMYTTDLPR